MVTTPTKDQGHLLGFGPMKIRPLHDQVLVVRKNPETVTASGIVLAERAQRQSQYGEVIACGVDVDPSDVAPGSVVLIAEWTGKEIELEGRKALFVRLEDLLAVVEDPI